MNYLLLAVASFFTFGIVAEVLGHFRKKKEAEQKLVEGMRDLARKRELARQKADMILPHALPSVEDKEFWGGIYKDKSIETIRVSQRQKEKLYRDETFLSNTSGHYSNVLGLYKGQKVMNKFPKKDKNGNSNKKTKKGTVNK